MTAAVETSGNQSVGHQTEADAATGFPAVLGTLTMTHLYRCFLHYQIVPDRTRTQEYHRKKML
jgi:hypothetical protein